MNELSETFRVFKNFCNRNKPSNIFGFFWSVYYFNVFNKKNSASKTVSVFFLIPPTSAIMAFIFLGENLDSIDIFGFLIATL